jgi:hypothetical protein
MKIRNGFVSNSSSSSFVIVAARVVDLEKAQKFQEAVGGDCAIESLECIMTGESLCAIYCSKCSSIEVGAFDGSLVDLKVDPANLNDLYFVAYSALNEGDCDEELMFAVYDGGDLSTAYFEDNYGTLLEAGEAHGLADVQIVTGCGRNG